METDHSEGVNSKFISRIVIIRTVPDLVFANPAGFIIANVAEAGARIKA